MFEVGVVGSESESKISHNKLVILVFISYHRN